MNILVLSFYYQPDLSAGSFRTTALVESLLDKLPDDAHIDVVTTLPNRYKSFSSEAPEYEQHTRHEIFRIKLPSHQSGLLDQSKAFYQFLKETRKLVSQRQYDLVYATSSRLMTAVLGAWIASRKGAHLYLDIRDIFVDTINDVFSRKLTFFVKPVFSLLEYFAFSRADKINLVSEGFKEYFLKRYADKRFSFFTNGIDKEFIDVPECKTQKSDGAEPVKVLYAGNMGEGQGLHMIIPALAKKMQDKVQFILIGDGGRKVALQSALDKYQCTNVELRPPVGREELIQEYCHADILFLHLNDYNAFRKVLPSKLFEYAALGKPIWAGVSGYAASFVEHEIENASVFYPCDTDAAVRAFANLSLAYYPRKEFVNKFARGNIMSDMADDIISII